AACQILEVDLVHDADPRRHDLERVERLHAPLHELVTLGVALEFDLHVEVERIPGAVVIDLHRMVDDEIDGHQRLDQLRVPAHALRDAAHRGEVAQQGNAGEILQHDARYDEGNFLGSGRVRSPAGGVARVLFA